MTYFRFVTELSIDEVLEVAGVDRSGRGFADGYLEHFHTNCSDFVSRYPLRHDATVGFGVWATELKGVRSDEYLGNGIPVFLRLIGESAIERGVFGAQQENPLSFAYWEAGGSVEIAQYWSKIRERYGAFGPPVPSTVQYLWDTVPDLLREQGIEFRVETDPIGDLENLAPLNVGENLEDHWKVTLANLIANYGTLDGTIWFDAANAEIADRFIAFFNGEEAYAGSTWANALEGQLHGTYKVTKYGNAFLNRAVVVTETERQTIWERENALETLSSLRFKNSRRR